MLVCWRVSIDCLHCLAASSVIMAADIHAFPWCAEQTRQVELEASVVTLKHAASADDAGLINPLLKKAQQHQLSQKVGGQTVKLCACSAGTLLRLLLTSWWAMWPMLRSATILNC